MKKYVIIEKDHDEEGYLCADLMVDDQLILNDLRIKKVEQHVMENMKPGDFYQEKSPGRESNVFTYEEFIKIMNYDF